MALNRTTSLCYAAIIDDIINQLAILGKVMPTQLNGEPDAGVVVNREIGNVIKNQRTTEGKLEAVLSARGAQLHEATLVQELKTMMNLSIRGTEQTMEQSPLSKDNFIKMQQDRLYVEQTLFQTQVELIERSTFQSLTEAVRNENQSKLKKQYLIIKEEQSRNRLKQLYQEVAEVNRERELEKERGNERVAFLKDQLQEMKAKGNMEAKYIKSSAMDFVEQGRRRCKVAEEKLTEKVDIMKEKQKVERRSFEEVNKYMIKHQNIFEEKLEFWMEKYETDTDRKQHDLETLIENKAQNLARLNALIIQYAEYEKQVVHDRITKEQIRRKKEQEDLKLKSATIVQSWWRTYMVMRQLGLFKKKKGKKGKK